MRSNPHEQFDFSIDEVNYSIYVYLSLGGLLAFQDAVRSGKSGKEALAQSLYEAMETYTHKRPTIKRILECDEILQNYAAKLINSSNQFKAEFDKTPSDEDIFTRFSNAIGIYVKTSYDNMSDSITKFTRITDAILPIYQSEQITQNALLQTAQRLIDFSESVKPITNGISTMISQFAESVLSNISALIKTIHIPTISEEQKEELIEAYTTWGSYGWSVIPFSGIAFYNNKPENMTEANNKALSICTSRYMQGLFDNLKNVKKINQSDLSNAIDLYQNENYKPAVMLLFSLIDAILVGFQDEEEKLVGYKAILKFETKIKDKTKVEDTLLFLLQFLNVLVCLKEIYKTCINFKEEPMLINRNFVVHGMATRKVMRIDCTQLFVLYWNILEIIKKSELD